MLLGLLVTGMCLGALAAGTWIAVGGSIIAALALYACVASGVILAAAAAVHLLPGFRMANETVPAEHFHAAE